MSVVFHTRQGCAHIALMLGLCEQHLPKIKLAKIQAWMGNRLMSSHSHLRSYQRLMAAGEGRVSILQGCCPEEAAYGPVDVLTPMYI